MDTPRIRMGHPYGVTPRNTYRDFEWIRLHETELLEKYGECGILVFEEKVLGTGASYAAALENAEYNLPVDVLQVTPVYDYIRHRQPFFRVQPTALRSRENNQ